MKKILLNVWILHRDSTNPFLPQAPRFSKRSECYLLGNWKIRNTNNPSREVAEEKRDFRNEFVAGAKPTFFSLSLFQRDGFEKPCSAGKIGLPSLATSCVKRVDEYADLREAGAHRVRPDSLFNPLSRRGGLHVAVYDDTIVPPERSR